MRTKVIFTILSVTIVILSIILTAALLANEKHTSDLSELTGVFPGITLQCDDVETADGVMYYYYKNTDACAIQTDGDYTVINRYGREYPMIYFEHGIPEQAVNIYNTCLNNNIPAEIYTSDFKDGDTECKLQNVVSNDTVSIPVVYLSDE